MLSDAVKTDMENIDRNTLRNKRSHKKLQMRTLMDYERQLKDELFHYLTLWQALKVFLRQ